jgi:Domain of unknown function DUF11
MINRSRRIRFVLPSISLVACLGLVGASLTAGNPASAAPLLTLPPLPSIVFPVTLPPISLPPISLPPFVTLVSLPPLVFYTKNIKVELSNGSSGPHLPGSNLVYTAKVRNLWSAPVNGIGVLNPVPAGLTEAIWSCTATVGSTCGGPATGSGAINRSIDLATNGQATFTISARVTDAAASIVNTITIIPPGSFADNTASDNTATDADPITMPTTTVATTIPLTAPPTTLPPVPATAVTIPATTIPAPVAPTAPPAPQSIVVIIRNEGPPATAKKKAKKKVVAKKKAVAKKKVTTTKKKVVANK